MKEQASVERLRRYGQGVLTLEIEDLLRLLPQRPPLLLLDRVLSLIPAEHAVGEKAVTGDELGLSARRRGFVYPSTYVLESLCQLGMVVVAAGTAAPQRSSAPSRHPMVCAVRSFAVRRELVRPTLLHLTVSVSARAPRWSLTGVALADGSPCAEAEFDLEEAPQPPPAPPASH